MIHVDWAVKEFYSLEALTCYANTIPEDRRFLPSVAKWLNDLYTYREKFINQFAKAIFDYTVTVVAGEMCHCYEQADHFLDGEVLPSRNTETRNSVYAKCTQWTARSILSAGVALFDPYVVGWEENYGGEKWCNIAKAGLLYYTLPAVAYVDHCIDLSHNNSVYFDKGAGIFCFAGGSDAYRDYLDLKRCSHLSVILLGRGIRSYSKSIADLVYRATRLGILDEPDYRTYSYRLYMSARVLDNFEITCQKVLDYIPIEWGNKHLTSNLDHNWENRGDSYYGKEEEEH